jgi:hypothetical protein
MVLSLVLLQVVKDKFLASGNGALLLLSMVRLQVIKNKQIPCTREWCTF